MKTGIANVLFLSIFVLGIWGSASAADITSDNATAFSSGETSSYGGPERDGAEHLKTDSVSMNSIPSETAGANGIPSPENTVSKDSGGGSLKLDAVISVLLSAATFIAFLSIWA